MPVDAASDFSAPDGIEPVVGWRMWILEGNRPWSRPQVQTDDSLRSLNGDAWIPGKRMEAVCDWRSQGRSFNHREGPESKCRCGVYAFPTIDALVPMLHAAFFRVCILGEVSLWGKIIVHEQGYRAQYAYPKRLWVDKRVPGRFIKVVSAYGVPVATTEDEEFRRIIRERVYSMVVPDLKDAAAAYLCGEHWFPRRRCAVCQKFVDPGMNGCSHCRKLKRQKNEERVRRLVRLQAPRVPLDMPPRFNSEVNKAKLRALAMAGALTAVLATLSTHPPQGL
jgi:hypothetical protein